MSPTVSSLCDRISAELGVAFNHAVVLLYRGDEDCIGFHQDKTLDLVPGSPIVSVSLGAERPYVLKNSVHQATQTFEFVLPHGALLILGPKTNSTFYHSIRELADTKSTSEQKEPTEPRLGKVRVSVTLRAVGTFRDPKSDTLSGQGAAHPSLNWPEDLKGIHRLDQNLDAPLSADSDEDADAEGA